MLHHFNCPHSHTYREWSRDYSLVFDWDDETGEVTGRDAEQILAEFRLGHTDIHPIPSTWDLTSTKNKTDMAAVIGYCNELPDVLKDHYPQIPETDDAIYDMDGNVIGHVDF
jgi:hypothetical protein